MRFVWAVAAFVLAALMIGAGIAQRTIFEGPRSTTASFAVDSGDPYILLDGAVLDSEAGSQSLKVTGDGPVFVAYARTTDALAWLSTSPYTHITMKDDLAVTTDVEPSPAPTDEGTDAEGGDSAEAAPTPQSPVGSDLWLEEFQQDDSLATTLQLPADMSVLIASDGVSAAPADVTITWPIQNATPWSGPLIVGGAIVMAVGVVLYILGIRHLRRSRGPRRKGLPVDATQPIDVSLDAEGEAQSKGVISSTPTRRSISRGRKAFIAVPVLALTAAGLAGCSADSWPVLGASPTPSPTATVIVPEGQQAPAVTKGQAERILQRISSQVATSDESTDKDAAAVRLDGAMLAERLTNYTLRGAIAEQAPLPAVADSPISLLLPQAFDGWPRTFLAVVEDRADKTSTIMLAQQADAWSDYKLLYSASLEASTEMPTVAPDYVGASQVPPDSAFLLLPPDELAAAYADVIDAGEDSEYADLFQAEGDQFRAEVASDRESRLATFNETGAETGTLTFDAVAGSQTPVALATLDSGAIVAVTINENETVKPTSSDAVIKLPDNPTVSTLSGATQSATGFTTTFVDQLFFYVPASGSAERIQLLGHSSNILDAKVIQ